MRILHLLVIVTCAALISAAPQGPARPGEKGPATDWEVIAAKIGQGQLKDDVYTIVLPRKDLDVHHLDLGLIPPAAGIEHRFHFFMCPCGKGSAVGTFAVADYEMNDVIDELRKDNFKIVSTAPMFMGEKPRMMALRFQGEGSAEEIGETLKKALKWTGDGRNKVE